MDLTTPTDEHQPSGSRSYALALRSRWPFILLAMVIAVAAAVLASHSVSKTYEAEADLLVTPISSSNGTLAGLGLLQESSQSRAALTASRFIQSPQVARGVAAQIGGNPNRLLRSIQVTPLGQSDIVTITGHSRTRAGAADIANAFADVTIKQRTARFQHALSNHIAELSRRVNTARAQHDSGAVAALSTQLAAVVGYLGSSDPTLDVARRAVPPTSAVQPRTKMVLIVAALGALFLAAAIVWALELIDPRVRDEEQLSRKRVLARLPALSRRQVERFLREGVTLPADALHRYRKLAEDVVQSYAGVREGAVILVAAPRNERTKSVTALALGALSASAGLRSIVVDADSRNPALTKSLLGGRTARDDLGDLLAGTDADAVLEPVAAGAGRLLVVPSPGDDSRRSDGGTVEAFGRAAWRKTLERLRRRAQVVVVNAPTGADAAQIELLASMADVTLVTVELDTTSQKTLDALFEMLADRAECAVVLFTRNRASGPPVRVPASAEPQESAPAPDVVEPLHLRDARRAEPTG